MTDAFEEYLAGIEQASQKLREIKVRCDDKLERSKARREAAEEIIAQANRKGENGNDWRILQRRIDDGKTTLLDINTGDDISPEAKAVRKIRDENIKKMGSELEKYWEEHKEQAEEFNELQSKLQEMEAKCPRL